MIGVFGGTFDPVHYGHIKPVLSIKQSLGLSQLRFIPNRVPPHREPHWLSTEQRLALLQLALDDFPDVCVDRRELNRSGPSYMVDTLHSLREDFPDESLCLIIGMDAFYGISGWYQWKSLFGYCHLVVTTRPGYQQQSIAEHMDPDDYRFIEDRITQDVNLLSTRESGQILLQSVPQLDISSTQIRQMLESGTDISQWMPEAVYQQLKRNKLDDN